MTIETSGRLPATGQISPTSYAPPRVSWEDYLRWAIASEFPSEWVDGEIIEIMPPNRRHLRITRLLILLLSHFIERENVGELFFDFKMLLSGRPSGRVPDILFVANDHGDRVMDSHLDGPADLVVEVVSPDSEARDRRDKHLEYEAAGIPEYWLIDEPRSEAHFFVLRGDAKYHEVPPDADGIYTSTMLPGVRLRVDWLWRSRLPTLAQALADLPG